MDAKITKQRLSNLFAYDWLKMLVVIAVAVLGIVLIFTMAADRPTNAQTFAVYGYTDVRVGVDNSRLTEKLDNGVFSYDIRQTTAESFYGNQYSGATYTARRSAGEGTVMFMSSLDGEFKQSPTSALYSMTHEGIYDGKSSYGGFYDVQYFLEEEVASYLREFYGEELAAAQPDGAKVRARFLERNSKDNRFRSAANKEKGVLSETERLNKLRDDYFKVKEAFANGKLFYTALDNESGESVLFGWGETRPENTFVPSVSMSALADISKLYYVPDAEGKITTDSLNLVIFHNSAGNAYDLCYEAVSFLDFLVGNYA